MSENEQNGATRIQALITETEVNWQEVEIFIRAFKKEELLEVWGKNKMEGSKINIRTNILSKTIQLVFRAIL